MTRLRIGVEGDAWLGGANDAEEATFGAFAIRTDDEVLTEVQDRLAKSTRDTIRVPTVHVAHWLLMHWWRLRWEPQPKRPTSAYRHAHCLAAIGLGIPWPVLDVVSDGETVLLTMHPEPHADAAAIRYLSRATVEVTATEWERAVDAFVETTVSRLGAVLPHDTLLRELRDELAAERGDPALARRCRLEAMAGFDAGDAPDAWWTSTERLVEEAGEQASADLLADTGGGDGARQVVDTLKRGTIEVDVAGLSRLHSAELTAPGKKPWERASAAARRARAELGVSAGPVSDKKLGELLGASLGQMTASPSAFAGAFRPRDGAGNARVVLRSERPTSRRFALARMMGLAALLPRSEQVLPLSSVKSATQKFGRAFAQELLCPWDELDAYTNEHGVDDESIGAAADRYQVSEQVITAALVNKGKLDRDRLAAFAE
jgi:hypothetical protein